MRLNPHEPSTVAVVVGRSRARAYAARARMRAHKRLLDAARAHLVSWRELAISPYLSLSGGKDSAALAALVAEIDATIPAVHICSALCLPVNCATARAVAQAVGLRFVEVRPDLDPWAWIDAFDGDLLEQANNAASELDRLFFFEPIERWCAEQGAQAVALGLRAEESRARMMNARTRGAVYRKKNGVLVCQPLLSWGVEDVFAQIAVHNLPISPIYGMDGVIEAERIREGWWLPGRAARFGSAIWIKRYYPEIWSRLVTVRPELTAWA